MAQEERYRGEHNEKTRYSNDGKEEVVENNWGGKVALFALLLCACFFIIKYTPIFYNANKAPQPDEIDKVIMPGFFGKVEKVKVLEDYTFKAYCNDAVTIEYQVVYKLRADITQEALLQYHPDNTKGLINQTLRSYTSKESSIQIYGDLNTFSKTVRNKLKEKLDAQQIDLFQLSLSFDENFRGYIKHRKDEQIKAELTKQEVQRHKDRADAEVEINKALIRAEQSKQDALEAVNIAKIKRQAREQFIKDSLTQVFERQLKTGKYK